MVYFKTVGLVVGLRGSCPGRIQVEVLGMLWACCGMAVRMRILEVVCTVVPTMLDI